MMRTSMMGGSFAKHGLQALILAAIVAPAAAQAQTATGPGTPYNLFNSVTNSGTFGNNGPITGSTFTNVFTFLVTQSGMLAADFTNPASSNNGPSDIDFSSATLVGPGGSRSFSKLLGETTMPSSLTEVWGITPVAIVAGTYTLTINGQVYNTVRRPSTATFSGNFNVDVPAVPEPATWGMMIVGFAAAGVAMRRRAKVRTNVSFA